MKLCLSQWSVISGQLGTLNPQGFWIKPSVTNILSGFGWRYTWNLKSKRLKQKQWEETDHKFFFRTPYSSIFCTSFRPRLYKWTMSNMSKTSNVSKQTNESNYELMLLRFHDPLQVVSVLIGHPFRRCKDKRLLYYCIRKLIVVTWIN